MLQARQDWQPAADQFEANKIEHRPRPATGAYVSRGLSFKRAEFETLTLALTADQIRMYDKAAELWSDIRNELQKAIALTNASARLMSLYWGCHQVQTRLVAQRVCMNVLWLLQFN